MTMYATAWLARIAGSDLPTPALDVACVLAARAEPEGGSTVPTPPTVAELAETCRAEPLAVRAAVSALHGAGFLAAGRRSPNVFASAPTSLVLVIPNKPEEAQP